MTAFQHTTVMLREAIEHLLTAPEGHYVDATFGRGGHARLLLSGLHEKATLTVFDKDPQAIATATELAREDARIVVRHESFTALGSLPAHSVQGVLMDLGVSSPQIDDCERGFSFRSDGPLDMRMNDQDGITAAQWLATSSEAQIGRVIREFGEERFARPIAQEIVRRVQGGFAPQRTLELAQLVASVVRTREGGQHPATRTFQALRIAVNRELDDLQQALSDSLRVLVPGGRLVVISFHSLEDRIVKQFIARHSKEVVDRADPAWMLGPGPVGRSLLSLELIGRFKPSEAEIAANPRARSAVMRVAQRCASRAAP